MHNDYQSHPIYDVIIAGAGPVGLFLAFELRLAHLSVLVLEQAEQPYSPLKQLPFGLRGLSVPSVEAFQRRGPLGDIAPDLFEHADLAQPNRPGGHFAGIQFSLDDVDTAGWTFRLPGMSGASRLIEMARLESALAQRALAMGAEVKRGCGVEHVAQTDGQVNVQAGGQTFHGRWLVGCDGGRSMVRKVCGFDFVGTAPEFTGYSVHIEMQDPDKLPAGRHYTAQGMYTFQKPGTIAMVDFDGGAFHRSEPMTRAHVEAVLRRVSGGAVTVTALHTGSTWTDRACQATTYRKGRVLLAGDAAHIHSPLGGQGLNLGIGDAMNLGWKLAATIHHHAPDSLLDSYTAERHPVGAKVLDWSRAQVALMRPTPGTRALAAIIRDLMKTRDGATYFAGQMWGVSVRYDMEGSHALVGRSCPDFALSSGATLADYLQHGAAVLLDFSGSQALKELAGSWRGQVSYVACDAVERLGLSAVLVRPDGVVACACEAVVDPAQFALAASRWMSPAPGVAA